MDRRLIIPLGGCQIHNPMSVLIKRGLAASAFTKMGFKPGAEPHTFTPNAAIQLLKYCRGELEIPAEIRPYCRIRSDTMLKNGTETLARADFALLEPVTSMDIVFRDYCFNASIVHSLIGSALFQRDPALEQLETTWLESGIPKGNEETRSETAAALLEAIQPTDPQQEAMRAVIAEARGRPQSWEEMRLGIERVRNMVSVPLGIVLYTYQYLPDGRELSWPPDLKKNTIAIAQELDMPVYEPARLINHHGVKVVLRDDIRHYQIDFIPIVADALWEFMDEVTGSSATGTKAAE